MGNLFDEAELTAMDQVRKAGVRPAPGDGFVSIVYGNEGDLQRSLAEVAEAYGWLVEREVVVPGWGRIDIVLRETPDGTPYLIEVKPELSRPAQIRKAFQQADGYGRWWKAKYGIEPVSILTSAEADMQTLNPVAYVYPGVLYLEVGRMTEAFRVLGQRHRLRLRRTGERVQDLRIRLEIAMRAEDRLGRSPEIVSQATEILDAFFGGDAAPEGKAASLEPSTSA